MDWGLLAALTAIIGVWCGILNWLWSRQMQPIKDDLLRQSKRSDHLYELAVEAVKGRHLDVRG